MDLLEELKCSIHDDEKVEFLCLSEICREPRLFCYKCIQQHQSHLNHFSKLDNNLITFLQESQQIKNTLLNTIKQNQLQTNQECEILLKDINLKYNISLKMLNQMKTFQEKNQAICELVKLKRDQKILLTSFQQKIDFLVEEIEILKYKLNLEELNYIKQVDVCQKESIFLFQKAHCIYKDQEDQALKLINEALEFNQSNIECLNLQSEILLNKQQINEAEFLIEKSFGIDPNRLDTILLKTKISPQNLKIVNKIITHYDKIAKYYSENDKILFEKANGLFNNGFYKESLNYFCQLISKDIVDLDKIFVKGQELRKQGKLEEAIIWFDRILEFDSKYFNAINSKGEILLSQNKNSEALSFYSQQLNDFQDRKEFRIGKCEALIQLKKYREAIEFLSENPIQKYLPKIKKHCQDLIQQQCYADAIVWSKAILLIDDTEQEFFTDCAQSLYSQQLYKESETWFDQAQKLQKKYFSGYFNYTYTLFQINKFEEAFNMFCCMLEFNRQDTQKYLHIAEDLFKKGEFEQSYKWFLKFKSLNISISSEFVHEVFNHCQYLFKSGQYFDSLKWAKLIAYSDKGYIKTFQSYAKQLEGKRYFQDAKKWNEIFLFKSPEIKKNQQSQAIIKIRKITK